MDSIDPTILDRIRYLVDSVEKTTASVQFNMNGLRVMMIYRLLFVEDVSSSIVRYTEHSSLLQYSKLSSSHPTKPSKDVLPLIILFVPWRI